MNELRSLFLATALLIPLCAAAQEGGNLRHVSLGESRVEENALVIPLVIDDISDVVAIDINLLFDRDTVSSITADPADLLAGLFLANAVSDTLKIAYASASGGTGSGAFAEIRIEPADANPNLAFVFVSLNGDQIPVVYDPMTAVDDSMTLGSIKRRVRNSSGDADGEASD